MPVAPRTSPSPASTLQLERRLGKQATASVKYSYTRADSDNKLLAYTENAISAQLTLRFGTPAGKTPEPAARRSGSQLRESLF